MASKNINIELSIYERLLRIKKHEESFSELLARLLSSPRIGLMDSFGSLGREAPDYREIKKSRCDRDVVL